MQNETKIQLSSFEQSLLKNAEWILTKNGIIEKMKLLLQECLEKQTAHIHTKKNVLPEEITSISPKIAKGENHKGLPWLMLDYPRFFEKENCFAIRTFFWWGNYFSTTLHLSGKYKKNFEKKINTSYHSLSENHFYLCINENEWEHQLEEMNYKRISEMTEKEFQQIIIEKKFIKLSIKFELDNWQELPMLTSSAYKKFLEMLP